MTISVTIRNTNGMPADGSEPRKVRATYVYKGGAMGGQEQIVQPDLGPGEEVTVHIHDSADVRIEEVAEK